MEITLQGAAEENQPVLACGEWNPLLPSAEPVAGHRLVARPARHIELLEASWTSRDAMSIHVRLTGGTPASLLLTLTAANGRRLGVLEVFAGPGACDLILEMPLVLPVNGPARLKVSLSQGGHVVDNARIDLGQAESTRR